MREEMSTREGNFLVSRSITEQRAGTKVLSPV